eukprot:TRINITY_DN854_c3_g1_i1.p1 TRINITY_DN854_c3_g1~~TRINITY_DN854_c3_g1_i1.p1  ORF type:complete len:210 (+),score=51.62 TRINITY_DN854_c3_g1_i1:39-632(+)
MELEQTVAIIKPDAVRNGHTPAVLESIRDEGFVVVAQKVVVMTEEMAGEFYEEHRGKQFFGTLIDYMSGGPSRVLVLAKVDAILDWRKALVDRLRVKFAEDPDRPGHPHPTYNGLHGSSDPQSAAREVKFWFSSVTNTRLPTPSEAREYTEAKLKPILVKALTELVKVRPQNQVKWLSEYLIENNPNKPTVLPGKRG